MTPAGTATTATTATTVAGLPVQTFTPSSFLPAQRDAPLLSAGVDRDVLRAAYVGRPLESVRTPAAVVDIGAVRRNCARMLSAATQQWRAAFRAHVKTHKTPQVALLQLAPAAPLSPDQPAAPPTAPTTSRTVVSTFPEAWGLISASGQDAFVRDQLKQYLDDILYSLPLPLDKLEELFQLRLALRRFSKAGTNAQVRLMVDQPAQVEMLEAYMRVRTAQAPSSGEPAGTAVGTGSGADVPSGLTAEEEALGGGDVWPVFIKIDSGGSRAGNLASSREVQALLQSIVHKCPHVVIYGFYAHAGQSYASKTVEQADMFLQTEVEVTDTAARCAREILAKVPQAKARHPDPFVLSVGSTPTAHAALARAHANKAAGHNLSGVIELHAGNYPFLDLQQVATNAIPTADTCGTPDCAGAGACGAVAAGKGQSARDVAFSVLSSVVSTYPSRPNGGEALCDAGGIAMSKDAGPLGSYGHVVSPPEAIGWCIARPAQEHGMLAPRPGTLDAWRAQWNFPAELVERAQRATHKAADATVAPLTIGHKIRILPQHSCLTAAQYPWYYVVDSGVALAPLAEAGVDTDANVDADAWWTIDWPKQPVVDVFVPWKFW